MRAFLSGKAPAEQEGLKTGFRVPLLADPAVSGVLKDLAPGDEEIDQAEHRYGLLTMTIGVLLIVPDGTITKMVHCTPLTAAAWRLALTAVGLTLMQAANYGPIGLLKKVWNLGRWGLLVSLLMGLSNAMFSIAVRETTVANVVLCCATSPIFAAILGWVALGTPIRPKTWIAMPIVFFGVAISISGGLRMSLDLGEIIGLLIALMGAVRRTIMREHSHVDMQPAATLGHTMVAAGIFLAGDVQPLQPGDFWPLFVLGLFFLPASVTLMTVGTQRLPATESCLLTALETVFSPIMAAYCVGDKVPLNTWVGLGLVVTTLTLHSMPAPSAPLASRSMLPKTPLSSKASTATPPEAPAQAVCCA
mmetsp:Transcript_80215/g.166977  ORF Transcript_80215/g.166977 Transcript_80215/m.166977 type:complete len:362 (+) Transcript_80215:51-1136(+)